jgi:hypothetical protein
MNVSPDFSTRNNDPLVVRVAERWLMCPDIDRCPSTVPKSIALLINDSWIVGYEATALKLFLPIRTLRQADPTWTTWTDVSLTAILPWDAFAYYLPSLIVHGLRNVSTMNGLDDVFARLRLHRESQIVRNPEYAKGVPSLDSWRVEYVREVLALVDENPCLFWKYEIRYARKLRGQL